ncbi:MAG: aldo/keto reductase [Thaumarchaeota archaeon]|nr:aldo/keto reductase [Nitrososphaerota archaeon]
MIAGFATPEGTKKFSSRPGAISQNYKTIQNLTMSNVGIGTYLGNPDSQTDALVEEAVKKSILSGINVIDTAINYRAQKAERSVGTAIASLISQGKIERNQIFVSTKNGYVTNDADIKEEFWAYIQREYASPGVIQANDISSGYHCMTIPYLQDQLNRSLKNLGLDCIDLMYLHNAVEGQPDISRAQFLQNLEAAFAFYEKMRAEGKIRYYGMATWECYRVPSDNPQYLSLYDTVELAKKVGGENHGFRFIQLPYNLYYDQALMLKSQKITGVDVSTLSAAASLGIGVFTSVPLMQGRLLAPGTIPEFGNIVQPSLRCLQFIRSTPGVLAPLVGQKTQSHVDQNLQIMKIPPLSEPEFSDLVKKFTG